MTNSKNIIEFILCITMGYCGAHKFYAKKYSIGFLYLFTFGLFGIGWIYDCMKLLSNLQNSINNSTSITGTKINKNYELSYKTFSKCDDNNRELRYEYYDVEVKGTIYRNFDISILEIDHFIHFEFEPENEYDKNAIKILYDDIFIGYIPKNGLQRMVKDYCNGTSKNVCGFITSIDRNTKEIHIALGFYSN